MRTPFVSFAAQRAILQRSAATATVARMAAADRCGDHDRVVHDLRAHPIQKLLMLPGAVVVVKELAQMPVRRM